MFFSSKFLKSVLNKCIRSILNKFFIFRLRRDDFYVEICYVNLWICGAQQKLSVVLMRVKSLTFNSDGEKNLTKELLSLALSVALNSILLYSTSFSLCLCLFVSVFIEVRADTATSQIRKSNNTRFSVTQWQWHRRQRRRRW